MLCRSCLGRSVAAGLLVLVTVASGEPPQGGDTERQSLTPEDWQWLERVTKPHTFEDDPPLTPEQLYKRVSPAVVRIETRGAEAQTFGQASGFFVSADGVIATNYHAIAKARSAFATNHDGRSLAINSLVGLNELNDLALLKVDAFDTPFLQLAPDLVGVGAKVYAIGSPRGLTNTLSDGLVGGLWRPSAAKGVHIQTTAPISPGSSGGPLLAPNGWVVGVLTSSNPGGQNLNFAVPSRTLADLLKVRHESRPFAEALQAHSEAGRVSTQGIHFSHAKQYRKAIEAYNAAIKLDPWDDITYRLLAGTHVSQGDFAVALAVYKRAIELAPSNAENHDGIADLYHRLERWDDAIRAHERAVELDPGNPAFWFSWGETLEDHGQILEAIRVYKEANTRAVRWDTVDAFHSSWYRGLSLVHLGSCYEKLNRRAEAIAAFESVGPESTWAITANEHLKKLRRSGD